MANKENIPQTWLRTRLKEIFGKACVYIKYPASQYSSRGVSDLIFCIHGLYIAVEVKTETGKPTSLQKKFGEDVKAAGGFFTFMYGKDEKVVDAIRKHVRENFVVV